MFEIVQNLDFDLAAAMQPLIPPMVVIVPPKPLVHDYIFGLIKANPSEASKMGTRREPQPYRFIKGKREPNRRSRFAQK